MIFFKLWKVSQFDTFKILRIDLKMFTIILEKFFGFLITIMASTFVLSNSQTTKKTEMVLVTVCMILIFLQSNDIPVVFDIVREFRWISWWVCGHDEMNPKTDNTFNDPFCVGTLIFQVRGESLAVK